MKKIFYWLIFAPLFFFTGCTTDDCDHQPYAGDEVFNGDRKAAEYDPDDVADCFHVLVANG